MKISINWKKKPPKPAKTATPRTQKATKHFMADSYSEPVLNVQSAVE